MKSRKSRKVRRLTAEQRLLRDLLANDASNGTDDEPANRDGYNESDDDADFGQVGFYDLNREPAA